MIDIVVHHAELVPQAGGFWKLTFELTRDGETDTGGHFIAVDAIEWRVAQLNVTPREALEIILVEPYIDNDQAELDLLPTRGQARRRVADKVTAALDGGSITWQDGPPPFTVSGGEEPVVLADSGDGNPLDTILAESPVDPELIGVKREFLERRRSMIREQAAEPPTPITRIERPTPDELRARLMPPPGRDAEQAVTRIEETPSELAERVLSKRIAAVRKANRGSE